MAHLVHCTNGNGDFDVVSTGRNTRWADFWACNGFHSMPFFNAGPNTQMFSRKEEGAAEVEKSFFEKYWFLLLMAAFAAWYFYKK